LARHRLQRRRDRGGPIGPRRAPPRTRAGRTAGRGAYDALRRGSARRITPASRHGP